MDGNCFRSGSTPVTPLREADLGGSDDMTVEEISLKGPSKRGSTDSSMVSVCTLSVFDKENKASAQHEYKGKSVYVSIVVAFMLVLLTIGCLKTLGGNDMQAAHKSGHSKVVVQQEKLGVPLPEGYRYFLDANSPDVKGAVPVVWDAPGDGDVLQHILSRCVGLVAAGGAVDDKRQTHAVDEPLKVFEKRHEKYVNCFAGSESGIDRIIQMSLYESKLADVLYTPLIYEVGRSFDEKNPARMIAMFHDPVQRVASVFHVVKQTVPKFRKMTIEEFLQTTTGANSNNWMTRGLSNCRMSDVNEECLRVAKEVVEKKCVVGLTSDLDTSLELIIDRMGWGTGHRNFKTCSANMKDGVGLERLYNDLVEPGSADYEVIARYNKFDLELYEVAKTVFKTAL